MKNLKVISILSCAFFMGCASVETYKESDRTSSGIKVAIGKDKNVHVNDKIALLERHCRETPKVPLCDFEEVGKLTIREVHDNYSVVTPDTDFIFKEGQYFKFSMHCEDGNEKCKKQ